MFDWETHREAALSGVVPLLLCVALIIGVLAGATLIAWLPLLGLPVAFIVLMASVHVVEYRKITKRKRARDETGGTCG